MLDTTFSSFILTCVYLSFESCGEDSVSVAFVFLYFAGILHGLVRKLIDRVHISGEIHPALFKTSGSCIPPFDMAAMAFIAVAMKICYGLDDKRER